METSNKNPFMKFMYSDEFTTPDFLDSSISIISDITDTTRPLHYSASTDNPAKHMFEPILKYMNIEQLQHKCNVNNIQYSPKSNKQYLIFLLANEFNAIYKKFTTLQIDCLICFCKEHNICFDFENKEKIIQNIMKYNASYNTLNFIKYTDTDQLTSGQKISKYFNNVYEPSQYPITNSNQPTFICDAMTIKQNTPHTGYHNVSQPLNEEENIDVQIEKLIRRKNNLITNKNIYNETHINHHPTHNQYQTITFDFKQPQQARPPPQQPKKKKQNIPKNIKTIVWNHYIGTNIIQHKCLCCKKVLICNTNFEVGHVISEKMGGTLEINNLRPICFACNHSMGTENMIDFVVKYGLYIG
jgi:5-methylcytosine-specific restriction endonuclease McrA